MTDGRSNYEQQTIENAKKLKKTNPRAEIFVAAVGTNIGIYELANVVSSPPEKHLFRVYSDSQLSYAFKLASAEMNGKLGAVKGFKPLCNG